MVLIADCGSTKIDWCVLNGDKLEKRFFSTGVNALLMPEEKIRETFEKELAPEVKDFSIDEVYYYGAGCLSDEICSNVSRSIAACVPGAKTISVNSDLLAAARALCGTEPGIACILGTGSNSCYYDGKEIKGTAYIDNLKFDTDRHIGHNGDEEYNFMRPGGAAIAEYDELKVKEIRLTFKHDAPIAISEIYVLGR